MEMDDDARYVRDGYIHHSAIPKYTRIQVYAWMIWAAQHQRPYRDLVDPIAYATQWIESNLDKVVD